ncbi:endonuclease/exonuclease/phosphatase family protein [Kutzneria sp. NPDC051319]|uniref:endonuclease/exonuclease/phosphatase family protein n=1 Tax=Kutzneria sp. NPDC051319 TaxID=3155047 RepID=UPI00344011B5
MSLLTMVSYNLMDYNKPPIDDPRQFQQREFIRTEIRPDILCVQEFWHVSRDPDDKAMHAVFAEFADQLGMVGRLAWASSYCNIGVLWRPEVATEVAWQEYSHWQYHHTLGLATLDIGASKSLKVATTHLTPFCAQSRFSEAGYVAILGNPAVPAIIGADWNTVGQEPALDGTGHYDPEPYADQQPDHGYQIHQVEWSDDPKATAIDRRALERLRRAGLFDVAHHLRAPWQATTGHHPSDPHGGRRIDAFRASKAALSALSDHRVWDYRVGDHKPISVQLDTTALG